MSEDGVASGTAEAVPSTETSESACVVAPQPSPSVEKLPREPRPARVPAAAQNVSEPRPAAESHFWLTRHDQATLAVLSLIMFALLVAYWVRLSNWGRRPVEIDRLESRKLEFHLDINSATWVEFSQLDGIGDALARRIVADREQNGPFESVDDLRRVKGIGPKTLERMRPWIEAAENPTGGPSTEAAASPKDTQTAQ